jgi:predicted subunit of tRNA(5-methylaminomethyl-2-thiouridylate) methyltransferase
MIIKWFIVLSYYVSIPNRYPCLYLFLFFVWEIVSVSVGLISRLMYAQKVVSETPFHFHVLSLNDSVSM